MVSKVAVEFASQGADRLVRDEKRVEGAISQTAKTAQKSEAKTQRWMERHKTALLAIGAATSAVMAGIIAASPDLSAALSEVHLNFSMLAMSIGEDWAPAFEWLAGVTEGLAEAYEALPEPIQDVLAWGVLLGIGLGIISGLAAGLTWILTPLATWLGLTGVAAETAGVGAAAGAGGMSALVAALAIVAGALLGGIIVWALWKVGVIQALEDAFAWVRWVKDNTLTVLGNLWDNLVSWAGLVADSAGAWGARLALNWVDGIVSNVPFLGDALAPKIESLRSALDTVDQDIQGRWAQWNSGGGFLEGALEGFTLSPRPANRTVSDAIAGVDSWVFGTGATGTETSDDRMAGLAASLMPEGYQEYLDSIGTMQAKQEEYLATIETKSAEAAAKYSGSMTTMSTATETAGGAIETSTTNMSTTVASQFIGLGMNAPKWGSDLMGNFIIGLNSRYGELQSTLSAIRSMIDSALSFDLVSNDLMAERWGRDLVTHFSAGMNASPMSVPVPSVSGGTTYTTPVQVTIHVSGAQAQSFDERKIAALVKDEIGNALRGRGR